MDGECTKVQLDSKEIQTESLLTQSHKIKKTMHDIIILKYTYLGVSIGKQL